MTPPLLLFWMIAGLSVLTALGVVFHRNPIRSALLLVLNFVCLAVLYLMLNAQLLAMLQVLVYAGAIMVLFVFIIQVLNLAGEQSHADPLAGQKPGGLVLALGLLAGILAGIWHFAQQSPIVAESGRRAAQVEAEGVTQVQILGWDLFTRYVYPFELTSILLLVGAMGVILLTRRRGETEKADGSTPANP